MSISRQYELLQLPRSSHYRPRSSLAEGPEHRTHMSYRRRVPEAPVWQPKDEGVFVLLYKNHPLNNYKRFKSYK